MNLQKQRNFLIKESSETKDFPYERLFINNGVSHSIKLNNKLDHVPRFRRRLVARVQLSVIWVGLYDKYRFRVGCPTSDPKSGFVGLYDKVRFRVRCLTSDPESGFVVMVYNS